MKLIVAHGDSAVGDWDIMSFLLSKGAKRSCLYLKVSWKSLNEIRSSKAVASELTQTIY